MCLFVPHFVRQPCSKLDSRTLDEKEALPIHQISDFGAGEGVPLQHVFDKRPTLWSCPHTQFNRETSEDLVPEQEDENEEAEQGEGRQGTPMKRPQLPFRTFCVCTKEAIWTMTFIFVGASVTFLISRPSSVICLRTGAKYASMCRDFASNTLFPQKSSEMLDTLGCPNFFFFHK